MTLVKSVVGKVKLNEQRLQYKSPFRDDNQALRTMDGVNVLRPDNFVLINIVRSNGKGFGKSGSNRKGFFHFGVKPWHIPYFNIVGGGKVIELIHSSNKAHPMVLQKVLGRLSMIIEGTRFTDEDKVNKPEFINQTIKLRERIKPVMVRNIHPKKFYKKIGKGMNGRTS